MWFHSPVLDRLVEEGFTIVGSKPNKNKYDLIIISTDKNNKLWYAQCD